MKFMQVSYFIKFIFTHIAPRHVSIRKPIQIYIILFHSLYSSDIDIRCTKGFGVSAGDLKTQL